MWVRLLPKWVGFGKIQNNLQVVELRYLVERNRTPPDEDFAFRHNQDQEWDYFYSERDYWLQKDSVCGMSQH